MLPNYSSLSPPLTPSLRKGDYRDKIFWLIACQFPIPPEELAGKDQVIRDTDGGCRARVCHSPPKAQHPCHLATQPQCLPSSQMSHTPQASACLQQLMQQPLGLTHWPPHRHSPARPGDALTCLSQHSAAAHFSGTSRNQVPTADTDILLTSGHQNTFTQSTLLCTSVASCANLHQQHKPPGFGPPPGRWCFNKSKLQV